MWSDALLICSQHLRVESRRRSTLRQVLPFVLTVVALFAFALDADSVMLRRASAGLFWMTVLFAANLVTQQVAAVDRADGVADSLRLSTVSPAGAFVGRSLALFVQLTVVEVVTAALMVAMYDVRLDGVALLASAAVSATLAISAVGAVYGPLAVGLGAGRDSVLALLMLPVLAPVLLAAVNAFGVAFGTTVGPGWRWVAMLGMLSAIYLVAGAATAAALLDES